MKRTLLAACAVAFPLCSAGAQSLDPQAGAEEDCQDRMVLAASFVQAAWENEAARSSMFRWPDSQPFDVGSALTALLMAIRADSNLSHLGPNEFILLATRICEPLYEAYFD